MPPNVDQFVKIYDMSNFGYKNMNFEITKSIIGMCSVSRLQMLTIDSDALPILSYEDSGAK
jgi:hypothetical protein